ncbi:MAG: transglutaminase-like cysteine peptidase [Halieaceae bacterium]|nr:transglutaminase-like cysteine peptidase [Halieaceae bacterium]
MAALTSLRRYIKFPKLLLSAAAGLCLTASTSLSYASFDWSSVSSTLLSQGQVKDAKVRTWLNQINELKSQPLELKLRSINDYVNRSAQLASDIDSWGESHYWATPTELFHNEQGDSEDFALAKLLSLLMLGIHPERLIIVHTVAEGTTPSMSYPVGHTVLLCLCGDNNAPLILDSIETRIIPAERRSDLRPVAAYRPFDYRYPKVLRADNDYQPSQIQRYLAKLEAQGFPVMETQ